MLTAETDGSAGVSSPGIHLHLGFAEIHGCTPPTEISLGRLFWNTSGTKLATETSNPQDMASIPS